eukprot:gene14489-22181_t
MDGGNNLWLPVRLALENDEPSFAAFQNLYSISCDAYLAKMWCSGTSAARVDRLLPECEFCDNELASHRLLPPFVEKRKGAASYDKKHPVRGAAASDGSLVKMTAVTSHLKSVAFGVEGEELAHHIHACYPGQISVKIDGDDEHLVYEVYEATPCMEKQYEGPSNASEARGIRKDFDANPSSSSWIRDDEDEEGSAASSQKEEAGEDELTRDRLKFFFMEAFVHFREARVLRSRVALSSITGITLLQQKAAYAVGDKVFYFGKGKWRDAEVVKVGGFITIRVDGAEMMALSQYLLPNDDVDGVLVLDLDEPVVDFAARAVHSRQVEYNEFMLCGDWTPDSGASESHRHFIVGDLNELKVIVSELVTRHPSLRKRLAGASSFQGKTEMLSPDRSMAAGDLPPHRRRVPVFGPIPGLDDLECDEDTTVAPKVRAGTAGGNVANIAQMIEDERVRIEREEEMLKEKLEIDGIAGIRPEPNFHFPRIGEQ